MSFFLPPPGSPTHASHWSGLARSQWEKNLWKQLAGSATYNAEQSRKRSWKGSESKPEITYTVFPWLTSSCVYRLTQFSGLLLIDSSALYTTVYASKLKLDWSLNLGPSQRHHYCWSPHKAIFQINVHSNFLVSYYTWKPGNWVIPSSCQRVCLLKIPYIQVVLSNTFHSFIPGYSQLCDWGRINDLFPCGILALILGHKRGNDSIV